MQQRQRRELTPVHRTFTCPETNVLVAEGPYKLRVCSSTLVHREMLKHIAKCSGPNVDACLIGSIRNTRSHQGTRY